jgi:hypothetical protein
MVLYLFFLGSLTFKINVKSILKVGTGLVVGQGVSYIKHYRLYIYIIGLITYKESMLYLKTAQLWFKSRHFLGLLCKILIIGRKFVNWSNFVKVLHPCHEKTNVR